MANPTSSVAGTALLTADVGRTRAVCPLRAYSARPPSADEIEAERLLLRRVTEQILRDLTRSMWREYRRQKFEQRQAQERLIEQRLLERKKPRQPRAEDAAQRRTEASLARQEEQQWNMQRRLIPK